MTSMQPYEADRVDGARLAWIALVVVASLALVLALMYLLWNPPGETNHAATVPPSPRLEQQPRIERLATEQAQQQRLQRYGWVDARHRYARVPIRRAMERMAAASATEASPQGAAHE